PPILRTFKLLFLSFVRGCIHQLEEPLILFLPRMANPPEGSPEWAAQDKGPYTIAICWAVTAFSTLFVIARLYVRGKIMGKLQSDDWFTVAAQVSAPAQSEYRP